MKKNGMKILMMLVIALVATTAAGALPVTIEETKLDGDTLSPDETNVWVMDRNNEYEVRVIVRAEADLDNVQIEGVMRGYDHMDRPAAITDVFDMRENRTYVKTMDITVPERMDKDVYKLRLRIDDRAGDTTSETYNFEIQNKRHDLVIEDVVFSPYGEVQDGRALITSVRLRNFGMVEQEGVKVEARIPELGISAADYINEIEEGESVSSEELYMRIPKCTEEGTYDVEIRAEYHRGDYVAERTESIDVIKGIDCRVDDDDDEKKEERKTTLTIGPKEQNVKMGESVTYPVTIKNSGSSDMSYVLEASSYQNWAEVEITPQRILTVSPGESKTAYVTVSPLEDAEKGKHNMNLKIESDGKTLQDLEFTANVEEEEEPVDDRIDVKNVLLVGLLVLVVLLVILGLIIGFGKLRGNDKDFENEDDERRETYY